MIERRVVAIIGLGLVGGSIARDLAARGAHVIAFDRDEAALREALAAGCVRGALGDSLQGIEQAEWLVIAVPVDEAARVLEVAASRANLLSLITDVGSTKRAIVAEAQRLGLDRFVGSHPLAGGHRSGFRASREGLFTGATVFLTPGPETRPEAIEQARDLWSSLGARPAIASADAHDEHMAWVSHLPQVASTALAITLAGHAKTYAELGPGGRDVLRLAASAPEMWRGVVLENATELSGAIQSLGRVLERVRAALDRGDASVITELMSQAASWCTHGTSATAGEPGTAIAAQSTDAPPHAAHSDSSFNE